MKAPARYLLLALSLLGGFSVPLFSVRVVAFLIFFLLLVATVHNAVLPRMIRVRRLDPELRAGRQQTMTARLAIHNRLPIPVPRLTLLESPGQLYCDNPSTELLLRPNASASHSEVLRGERRGAYSYGPLRLHGCDPFGLFTWERVERSPGRAIILPRIHSIRVADRAGVAGGSLAAASQIYEDVTRFRSLREYSSGDDPKRVNWKASAKRGRLYTTEYERALTVSVTIILNLMESDYPTRKRDQSIERAVEVAAALLFHYSRLGQPIGLRAAAALAAADRSTTEMPSFAGRTGWAHTQQLLDALARIGSRSGTADYLELVFGAMTAVPSGGRLMVIGPVPNQEQAGQLRALRARRLRLDYYLVGSEESVSSDPLTGVCPVHRVADIGDIDSGR